MTLAPEVAPLVNQIRKILAGKRPELQGAVLADLLALWLAGHSVGNPVHDDTLREDLLANHLTIVRQLVPINVQLIARHITWQ